MQGCRLSKKNHLAFVYASSTNRTLIQVEERVASALLAPSGMLSFTGGRTAPHGGEGAGPCTQRRHDKSSTPTRVSDMALLSR